MREIVLEGPGKNAMSTALMSGLRASLRAAGDDAVLLTGAGGVLSAGLDLKEIVSLDAKGIETYLALLEALVLDLYTYAGPLVVAVPGHAIAGGCVLTIACDHRVLTRSPNARVGLNEVALGLRFPPRVWRLACDRVPRRHQEEVLLGASLFAPERALVVGLVDELADEPLAVARARLAALESHPRDAYVAAKARLRAGVLDLTPAVLAEFARADLPSWTGSALKARVLAVLARGAGKASS